ncbi:MAG: type II secretion system F family protein [Candidatus Bathyarchaeota archaeon]|nr:MAG: type II secretion system F family protein [Candidatus Bathyarchaeota archaeon]
MTSSNVKNIINRFLAPLLGTQAGQIDSELPFVAMMFTVMAASGVTLHESWKKLGSINLLPTVQKEAKDVVRQVEVLGYDTLTVMYKKAEETKSKLYRDFLAGYVSAVKSGGSLVSFLNSKLRSIFEMRTADEKRSVEQLGALVEAYSVMLIVSLCVYLLVIVIFSTSFTLRLGAVEPSTSADMYVLIFFATPLISFVFMAIANKMRKSTLVGIKEPYIRALLPTIGTLGLVLAVVFVPQLESITQMLPLPMLVTICFVMISIPSAINYHKIAKKTFSAEDGMPSFLRDVTEARKTGLSPEKSIIHASKRKGHGEFSENLRLVRDQLEWGVSLRKIFRNIKSEIRSWPVLLNFLILVETIEVGGGSTTALEILSEYSEKNRDIEKNKRAMLKPYIILSLLWSVLMALTITSMVYLLTHISLPGLVDTPFVTIQSQVGLFLVAIIFQCWLSGFFIGKISEGSFAAGFKYAAVLAVTCYVSLVVSENIMASLMGGMF